MKELYLSSTCFCHFELGNNLQSIQKLIIKNDPFLHEPTKYDLSKLLNLKELTIIQKNLGEEPIEDNDKSISLTLPP